MPGQVRLHNKNKNNGKDTAAKIRAKYLEVKKTVM